MEQEISSQLADDGATVVFMRPYVYNATDARRQQCRLRRASLCFDACACAPNAVFLADLKPINSGRKADRRTHSGQSLVEEGT